MRRLLTLLALSLLFGTSACSLASAIPLTPTPTVFVIPTSTVPPVPPLTAAQVLNAEYTLTGFDNATHAYRFVDGKFSQGLDATAPGFVSMTIGEQVAFGDLDGDGAADAAVTIAENFGGSGVFVFAAAVLNDNGQPRHVASTLIDDRPQINQLEIRDGGIFLDLVVHGPSDAMCCPTFPVTRTYELIGNALVMTDATSRTPDGQDRLITIEQPRAGDLVSGALTLSGSVTIAPFENTLRYRVYNAEGNELASGPLTVTAAEMGGPGTFSATLDLNNFPPGVMHIELSDLSAADGSVLALASVKVVKQ